MSKKIYIAGPMRGIDDFNFPAFDRAEHNLTIDGWLVNNPAAMDRVYEGWKQYPPEDVVITPEMRERFIRRDIESIFACDAIYMLRGWTNSKGAMVEYNLALFLELEILYE